MTSWVVLGTPPTPSVSAALLSIDLFTYRDHADSLPKSIAYFV